LAANLGYVGAPYDLRPRLMQINGVFHRSKGKDAELIFAMVLLMVLAAFSVFGLVKSAWRDGYNLDFWLLAAFIQVLLATVLGAIWWRFNTKYRIESGHLIALSRSGRVRWSESLSSLQGVAVIQRGWRDDRWLYMRWPRKSRHIELFDMLAAELRV